MSAGSGHSNNERRALAARFPALRLLRMDSRRHVPHVAPMSLSACGAACLTSVLNFNEIHASLREVLEVCGGGQEGTSALRLIDAGRHFGLRGRAISIELPALANLPPGTILFWGFNHFVVLERSASGRIHIVDPGIGRRRVPLEEAGRMFTGVAILFDRSESFQPRTRAPSRVWSYLRGIAGHRGLLTRVVITSCLLQLLGLGLPLLTGAVVDRVVPLEDVGFLQVIVVGCALCGASYFITSLMRGHIILHLRAQLDVRMTLGFLDHLVALPYTFFERRSVGDLMMRLNSNTVVREILTSSALSSALDGVLVLSYLVALLLASPPMGFLVIMLGLARVTIFLATKQRVRELAGENLAKQAASQAYQVQLFTGVETLKSCGAEARAVDRWSHLFVEYQNVALRQSRLGAWIQAIADSLTYLSPLLILCAGALLVMRGSLTLGTMLAASALGVGFLLPLSNLIATASRLQELSSYLERLDDVLDEKVEQSATPRTLCRLHGRIRLEGVTFRHGRDLSPAIEDVSIDIASGKMVAIVGRSGAGKSTLAKLLMGLYVPANGRILLDDVEMSRFDMRAVRAQIGAVMQQSYLFSGTVRENIALANPEASPDDIVWAARAAHVHDMIMTLPMQYDAVISAGGTSLSGGERQRIAIARAILSRPPILILDEATSQMDLESERRIQDSLRQLECTQIIIAHRLSTVRNADQIIVLANGRVVERGTHESLVEYGGAYAQLLAGHRA